MATCSFCKNIISRGTGKIYVLKSGKILNFCSNKCEKNMIKLRRKPSLIKWTKAFEKGAKEKAKEEFIQERKE